MTSLIPVPPTAPGYLRAHEAGLVLDLRSADVYRLIDQGRLTGYLRERFVVFAADEVKALAQAGGSPTTPGAPG